MKVNGEQKEYISNMTVEELIGSLGYSEDRIAVEVNGKIVFRADYGSFVLNNEDSVEIARLVGGG